MSLSLSWRVRARRKMLNMRQKDVARSAGIAQGSVSHIENETVLEPTRYVAQALCKALHCDYRWLIKGDIRYAPKGFYTAAYEAPECN